MPAAPLFAALEHEWATLAHSPTATAALARWRQQEPALAPLDSLDALVHAASQRGQPAACDRILSALARHAPDDPLAARVLLQLLLPGAKALSHRLSWLGDPEERAAAVVAAVYERIRCYPWARRPARVAANVLQDACQRLIRSHGKAGRAWSLEALVEQGMTLAQPEDGVPAWLELAELLGWAVRAGHLTSAQARLIATTRIADVELAELAGAAGVQVASLRRRRQRAEQALGVAARADSADSDRQATAGPCRVLGSACA